MCPSTFDEVLELITPLVQTEDTSVREAISPTQRLFVILRFLASGLTFENLKFETAIAAQTTVHKHAHTRFKLLCNKIQTCLKIVKLLNKQSNHTSDNQIVFAAICVAQSV
jgi:hypothetical protein